MPDQPPAPPAPRALAPRAPGPSRRGAVRPFHAMEVLARAGAIERAGGRVVHLEIGEPSAPAPQAAREAAAAALAAGRVGYTEALGRRSLREAIAARYGALHGLAVDPGRVAVTTGSSAGFALAFLAAFDAGDRVAVPRPGYPAYRNVMESLGLVPVELPVGPGSGHQLCAALVEEAHAAAPLAGALVMSPANPTGSVIAPRALADLAAACRRLGLRLISDEIYHGLTYGAPAATALASGDEAIVVNSFSKYHAMTGWRVGWLVLPPDLVRGVERLAQSHAISAPTLSQVAAEAALGPPALAEAEALREGYRANRDRLLAGLARLGFPAPPPVEGAFYAYLDVAHLTNDSAELCGRWLAEAGVAATPGLDFDPAEGHRHLRLSFAGPAADVDEALERLGAWLAARGQRR